MFRELFDHPMYLPEFAEKVVIENIFDSRAIQNQGCGGNQLVHLVEQVLLYRTGNTTSLVHSTFLIDFFVHCPSVVRTRDQIKNA